MKLRLNRHVRPQARNGRREQQIRNERTDDMERRTTFGTWVAILVAFCAWRHTWWRGGKCALASKELKEEIIVRLNGYNAIHVHQDRLEREINDRWDGCAGTWKYMTRSETAHEHPTDFLVMSVVPTHKADLEGFVRSLDFVKDVHPQNRYVDLLASIDSTTERSPGTRHVLEEVSTRVGYQPAKELEAERLWTQGYEGEGVKIGIFDTGIKLPHPSMENVTERTNWTDEDTLEDGLGHGSFVAGMVGSTNPSCQGFAPKTKIYTFRVFTNSQVSYTSWFLDAFNYAIATRVNIINLSIGGPDFMDVPFVEKIMEVTSNGIIMISAIGNDGPRYGTLNNPADQNDVIGVGGLERGSYVATFSSRGMSTWELPSGYGRIKPDVITFGRDVMGIKISSGCRKLSGTSVASPVVAGAVCLLASTVPSSTRWDVLNPASMKQALIEGAEKIPDASIFVQGSGKMNLQRSAEILQHYVPKATLRPPVLDFTDCPYMWPFCTQPLYAGALPTIFNATILNAMGVTGTLLGKPSWIPDNEAGELLHVDFAYSDVIWPWSGYLAIFFAVHSGGSNFDGVATGFIKFVVVSPPGLGESEERRCQVTVPVKLRIIPTPARKHRVLWDQYRNIRYPPAYIPRDSLEFKSDLLDWHGDHLHTNFHGFYDALRSNGYYVETSGHPLTCVNTSQYGTLIITDPEDEFHEAELSKVYHDVTEGGLGVLVLGEWYNVKIMKTMKFLDENTRSWWSPYTGGANLPALNKLLGLFGILLGDRIFSGRLSFGSQHMRITSGANIIRFPAGGHTATADSHMKDVTASTYKLPTEKVDWHLMGFTEAGRGRLAVAGDTFCFDSDGADNCFWAIPHLLRYTSEGTKDSALFKYTIQLVDELDQTQLFRPPEYRTDLQLEEVSHVMHREIECGWSATWAANSNTVFHQMHQETGTTADSSSSTGPSKTPPRDQVDGKADVASGAQRDLSRSKGFSSSRGEAGSLTGASMHQFSTLSVAPVTGMPISLDMSMGGRMLARVYGASLAAVTYLVFKIYHRFRRLRPHPRVE